VEFYSLDLGIPHSATHSSCSQINYQKWEQKFKQKRSEVREHFDMMVKYSFEKKNVKC